MQIFRFIGLGLLCLFSSGSVRARMNVVWPTEHPPVDMGSSYYSLLQSTESQEIQSGNFGCVRTDGNQFHEGIDLRSFSKDPRGEAVDRIKSVLPGVVVYVNPHASKSSYGRYIVIEHSDGEMPFLSLYAHLRSIAKGIARGRSVEAGQTIATMGRSASYTIPRERAHLHFEVALRMTDNFQSWYDWKKFSEKNDHGIFNGMNLTALNPALFFEKTQWHNKQTFRQVLAEEETAFTVIVSTKIIPDFIRRYPALVDGVVPETDLAGWRIEFTYYGLPKKWTPMISTSGEITEGKVALQSYEKSLLASNTCRGMLRLSNGKPTVGPGLQAALQLLFGFR